MFSIYSIAILTTYTLNIIGCQANTQTGRIIHRSVVYYFLFFIGTLLTNKILKKKHYKIILIVLSLNILIFCLSNISYYFSFGYLLIFLLIRKLATEKRREMDNLGISFRNFWGNIIIGTAIGILFASYILFVLSLTQGYKLKILDFDMYSEILLSSFFFHFFFYTFFIGQVFNHLLRKGANVFVSSSSLTLLFIVFHFVEYSENIKNLQYVFGTIFLGILFNFIYCGIFILCRNIIPIAMVHAIYLAVMFSFGVFK